MSEKTPPPVKRSDGGPAARGIKSGPPIDHNSDTLHGFEPVMAGPSGTSAGDTNAAAGEATLKPGEATLKPGSATMVPHDPAPVLAVRPVNLDQTMALAAGPADQTLQASPDATLGGLDSKTQEFHRAALAAAPKAVTTGQTFGQYELLEPIAKGGMGIVYKARQKTLNRIVAIKMILAGQFADQGDIDRFYAEAEAAAALSHPNIVAIHEIGEINGQHFFSMDFIEGKSLSGLIQENPVPPRRAAELTKIIAETMEFAHEKGVVHRDLKPANVLLDKRQRPLITDFGLAKQVSNTSQLTMAGSIVGTPSYMPPEQAAGKIEEVGTWSDLYSVGAILYELLTGRPPFRAASPFETIRQVLETEPPSPRLLNPNVPKDLETICLKCLQKERTRRYGSCQELSDELGRYLRGEPIQARPISQVARLWRLCKRYPIAAASLALAVCALIGASIFSTAAYVRTKKALNRESAALAKSEESLKKETAAKAEAVRRHRKTKQAINDLFTTVSENTLFNQPGAQAVRRQLLEKARAYYEELSRDTQDDPELAVDLADADFRLGRIAVMLGAYDEAIKPLMSAVETQKQLSLQQPDDPDRLKALADTLTQLGQVWTRKQDHRAASTEYDQAVKIREQLAARFPENTEYQRTLASAYMNAGLPAFNLAEFETDDKIFDELLAKAKDYFSKMQDVRHRLLARENLDPQFRREVKRDLGMGSYNLGRLARLEERLEDAINEYQAAAASFEDVLQDDPADLENQRRLALCRRLIGDLYRISNDLPEARKSYERGLARLDKLVKENPDVGEYEWLRAGMLLALYAIERDEQQASVVRLAAAKRARDAYQILAQRYPAVAVYRRDLAIALRELAKERRDAGLTKEAANEIQQAITILTGLVQENPEQAEYAERLEEMKELLAAPSETTN